MIGQHCAQSSDMAAHVRVDLIVVRFHWPIDASSAVKSLALCLIAKLSIVADHRPTSTTPFAPSPRCHICPRSQMRQGPCLRSQDALASVPPSIPLLVETKSRTGQARLCRPPQSHPFKLKCSHQVTDSQLSLG